MHYMLAEEEAKVDLWNFTKALYFIGKQIDELSQSDDKEGLRSDHNLE